MLDGLSTVLDEHRSDGSSWSSAAQSWYEHHPQLARDGGDELNDALSLRTLGKLYVLDRRNCHKVPANACLRLETSRRMGTDLSLL